MAVQAEPAYFDDARAAGQIVVTDTPKLDVESYIANYKGKQRIERLYHIAKTSTTLCHEAIEMAAREAKAGRDTELYEKVMALRVALEPGNSKAHKDDTWINRTTRENKAETTRLEMELKGYKNNLIKESIRMGYDDTGRHYQDIGELGDAVKAYTKERDVAQTPTHIAIMLQRVIGVSLEQYNWINVDSNVQKLRNVSQGAPSIQKHDTMYLAVAGLAQMSSRNYEGATRTFLSCDSSLLQQKPDEADLGPNIMTPSDIATYGALCAIASLDRAELQKKVLENSEFRQYLELEPHLRRAMTSFISGKFDACLAILEAYRADYLLDLYLAPHFNSLFERIRSKSIVQYFLPFSCVTFKALAEAFNTTEAVIESSLVELIKSRALPARLNLEKNVVVANKVDSRNAVNEEALRTAKAFERTAHQKILRMEILHAKLEVTAPHVQSPQGGDSMMHLDPAFSMSGLASASKKFFGGQQG